MKKTFTYKGMQLTLREISELPGVKISISSLYWRIVKKGMSVEAALAEKVKLPKKHLWKGKMLTSYQIAKDKEVQVSHVMILARLKAGQDIQSAALTPPKTRISALKPVDHNSEHRERLKRIMAIPVNPKKCRYTAHGGGL